MGRIVVWAKQGTGGGEKAPVVAQVKDSRDLDQAGGNGGGEQWWNYVNTYFKVRVTGFASELNVEGELKEKERML